MRLVCFLVLCFCLTTGIFASAQSEDWLPITPEDLQFKDVPGNPGAPAVRLYYAHYIDDNASSEFYYERIKILNEKALNPNDQGKTYADIEIPIESIAFDFLGITSDMVGLKARTIHPDGSIVEFTGKVFEKTRYKGRVGKLAVRAFSMPAVTVGSIVEYKYHLAYRSISFIPGSFFIPDEWVMQSDLYTAKEHLHYRPYGGGIHQSMSRPIFYTDGGTNSRVSFNLKEEPKYVGDESDLELHDVPAFEAEDYMPPENNFKPSVIFYYGPRGIESVDKRWQDLAKDRYSFLETILGRNGGVKEAAVKAIGPESDPTKQLQRLYERAQQVRNLTYERERTSEEMKKENLLRNLGVGDVLAHGYGTSEDITLLFVALARAAGFDASVVQSSDRQKRFFAKEWTSLAQLNHMMASVKLNGTDLFLEPGIKFCPFGVVRWNYTATEALLLNKKGGVFVKAPPVSHDKSLVRRIAVASLTDDGTLKANVKIEFHGEEALEHRLEAIDEDDAGRKKSLEDELKEWLPTGAIIKMTAAQGWETGDDLLVATFSVEVPSYASLTGKLFLVPSFLFQTKQNRAFSHATRKYPVYFQYPFTENDYVGIKLPAGFSAESIPQNQDASLKYARYQSVAKFDGTQLVSQRNLAFNGIYFELDKYAELKDFFGKVQTADEQQAVLRGGTVSAQKVN